ncbi:DUF6517 family protein [Halorubrum sp. AD140]|uniref:DUF6517 family protein n=1 Tax=Halorubrum sp. AD140 TaxID=3050073 RepID=UPI002ACCC656|nr:DUF6517 family protein [Halorubrum sp. AD140]MDZ5811126.1 DUF6517 family protein [Halorubrum sp. AD140]
MHRRGLLAALAASTTVAVAGCADAEDGSYEFDAEPARIPSSAASEAGYEGEDPESFTIEQEFDVAGVNAQVSATTWVAGYENAENGAALLVASTPDASVGGQSVNPLVRADDVELIRRLLEQVDEQGIGGEDTEIEADEIESQGSETRTVLGEEVEVSILETTIDAEVDTGEQSGSAEDVPVYLYVATVQHGDDVIALVGVHPTSVDAADSILSLMEQVEH